MVARINFYTNFLANNRLRLHLGTGLYFKGTTMLSILRKARLKDKEMRILMLWVREVP